MADQAVMVTVVVVSATGDPILPNGGPDCLSISP